MTDFGRGGEGDILQWPRDGYGPAQGH